MQQWRAFQEKRGSTMKKMRYFLMGLFCALALAGCAEREERSYLHTLVTEEQTLLRGNAMEGGEKPTPEDISCFLAGMGVEISMEDYAFEEADENAEGLLYRVKALSADEPDFQVYQIGNFCGITCSRAFLAQAIEDAENGLRGAALTYDGVMVGCYDAVKENIGAGDTEDIAQVERYVVALFPGLDFAQYERTMLTGDAGQNMFLYARKEGEAEGNVFSWTSYLQDDTVHIFVAKRAYLDELLHVSPAQ